ncbi:MAG: glycosyltransferase family 4 protein [Candidatus Saliniplasma sp.]
MKILMMTDELPEDILNFNVDLIINARYLSDRGHSVFLLSHHGKKIHDDKFQHLPLGSDIDTTKESIGSFIVRNFTFFTDALKKIKKIKPDLILCVGAGQLLSTFLSGVFFSRLFGVPIVCEWRGSDLLLKNSICRRTAKKLILKNSAMNIIRSEDMIKKAFELEPGSEIEILPSKGIDTDKFEPKSSPSSSSDKVKVLYVGRLHELKGLNYLIKAFSDVKGKYSDVELLIIGSGDLKDELKELVHKERLDEHVRFIGEVEHSELIDYYQNSDIFVLPSVSEGLSNVILEAMACGLPVIATGVGGNTELVKHEKGGLIVDAKDIPGLQRSLEKLLNDPELRRKMGGFNRKYVQKFNQDSVLSKKVELLEKVVGNK